MAQIKLIEKRSDYRHRYLAKIMYGSDEGTVGGGLTRDISLGGMLIAAERIVPVGTDVLVTVPFPKSTRYVSLRGIVERITDDGFAISFIRRRRQDADTGSQL